jgi:hypothetical protein
MGSELPVSWPEPERRLVGRYVRDIVQGRYDAVADAARACLKELKALRRSGGYRPAMRGLRTIVGVAGALWRGTRAARQHGRRTTWTPVEERVAVRHAKDLVMGRYGTLRQAALGCAREFEQMRERNAGALRTVWPRSLQAIESRIYDLAHVAGRARRRHRITPDEDAIYDRYAEALAAGNYRDVHPASKHCLKELERLRRKLPAATRPPSRTLTSVFWQLGRRASKLGYSWVAARWRPEERRILDRHVGILAGDDHPAVHVVARQCFREMEVLYGRRLAKEPSLRLAYRPRTYLTILTYLLRWSREKGRVVMLEWTPQEDKVVGRYARALIEARYADAPTAARACRLELARMRRQWRRDDPTKFKGTRPRSQDATYSHLCILAHRLNHRWPKTAWTDAEMKVCRQWIRWYERHRGVRRLKTWDTVAEGMQEELERINSRRSFSACQSKFWKEWRRVRGHA